MNLYEVLGLLSFLVSLGISLYKLYNLMHKCDKYDLRVGFLLFVGFLFSFLVSFAVMVLNPAELIYSVLFSVSVLFVAFQMILLFAEIVFHMVRNVVQPYQDAYASQDSGRRSWRL